MNTTNIDNADATLHWLQNGSAAHVGVFSAPKSSQVSALESDLFYFDSQYDTQLFSQIPIALDAIEKGVIIHCDHIFYLLLMKYSWKSFFRET